MTARRFPPQLILPIALALSLQAETSRTFSAPCKDVWKAAPKAWSSLGLSAGSVDRVGGTATLGAIGGAITGADADRMVRRWTMVKERRYYHRLTADVLLQTDDKNGGAACEVSIDPTFGIQIREGESIIVGNSSGALERDLLDAIKSRLN